MSRGKSPEVPYLFIDGGCLRAVLDSVSAKYFAGDQLDLNYVVWAREYNKVFYYDCLPALRNGESQQDYEARIAPVEAFFERLRRIDGIHVFNGTMTRRGGRGPEQKQVDIKIAVDMLTYSFRRTMSSATLLTGDLDFKPLIDALVQDGMHTILLYPIGQTRTDLIYAADEKTPLGIEYLFARSSSPFRKRHYLPQTNAYNGKVLGAQYNRVDAWVSRLGDVELYESASDFLCVFPYEADPATFVHVTHPRADMLRAFVDEMYLSNDAVRTLRE